METPQQTRSDKSDTSQTVEKAADQLSKPVEDTGTARAGGGGITTPTSTRSGHSLVIRISEGGQAKANVRIPLGLARAAMKLIPRKEKESLKKQGIDVEELLGGLTSNEQGAIVQVEDDGQSVWIGVE